MANPIENDVESAIRQRQRRRATAASGFLAAVVLVVGVVTAFGGLEGRAASVHAASPADGHPEGERVATATTADPPPAESSTTTTTSTTVPMPGACPVDAVELRVTSERPSYRPGERVVIHADGTNGSGRDCAPLESWELQIRHDDSQYGYSTATMAGRTEPAVWGAGETQRVTMEWSQEAFDGEREQPAPTGTYTVTVLWGVRDGDSDRHVSYTGSTTFELREA